MTATAVGYEGGKLNKPSYRDVCTDGTGHAEVVEIDYDPAKVSDEQLLDLFFELYDPTQMNRQGPDWGTQYRSVVFYHTPSRKPRRSRPSPALAKKSASANPSSRRSCPRRLFGAPRSTTRSTSRSAAR